ncbi:MAG: leucyl aminopeptidase [Rickettsiales bacterium]|nr:leucyl aminopeptidase [Rickettsiales bacterium]
MKINFENISQQDYHLVIISPDNKKVNSYNHLDKGSEDILNSYLEKKNKEKEIIETFLYKNTQKQQKISEFVSKFTYVRFEYSNDTSIQHSFFSRLLSYLETKKAKKVAILFNKNFDDKKKRDEILENLLIGFKLKDYRFEKYKNVSKKDFKIDEVCIFGYDGKHSLELEKRIKNKIKCLDGIFLTRDLVSEPANVLYPQKFVEYCKDLKKVGVEIQIFDEKKLKTLGMNALLGVAQGSVRPARVMIMKWNGLKGKKSAPIAFIGKGVTFDTGGISIKPSSGMEDMKWDMGGAGVVAGLMYTLAMRKAKANVIGAVGLVENMPDGNAQRPGDIVESLSGQTIEVLNTDAEGRLVLADVLWYINKKFRPKIMIDLATLTGAIIVALGERYAGLFSNDDLLVKEILDASKTTKELVWQMPMDDEFDKLLNCPVADMKNITGTRGAGSITAAQFLKRFVGKTSWAHLDIAGVTWSKKGTKFARPGGTGFGVRLLDEFVRKNYE